MVPVVRLGRRGGRLRLPTGVAAVALLLATGAAAAGSAILLPPVPADAADAEPQVEVTFDGPTIDGARVGGTAGATAAVVSDGGQPRLVPGADGAGSALRLPAAGQPAAAVVVTAAGGADVLSPGVRGFVVAADFRRDAGADTDGDNVVQRGLWVDPGQYKLQVDKGRASCVVAGTSGRVIAEVDEPVVTGVWYRLVCRRDGDVVRATLTRLDVGAQWQAVAEGPIGAVRAATPDSPLSIGAKVAPGGTLTETPDQFNGTIDNVVVQVDPDGVGARS